MELNRQQLCLVRDALLVYAFRSWWEAAYDAAAKTFSGFKEAAVQMKGAWLWIGVILCAGVVLGREVIPGVRRLTASPASQFANSVWNSAGEGTSSGATFFKDGAIGREYRNLI